VTVVPRCSHGNILLGCPEDVCPEQDAYVSAVADQYAEWYRNNLFPERSNDPEQPGSRYGGL
jgi:hypothetical protein